MISNRFAGAFGDRKSEIVLDCRRGRRRNSTGHSAMRNFFVAVVEVPCAPLGMTPDSVLQNIVPDVTASGLRECRIGAHEIRVHHVRVG